MNLAIMAPGFGKVTLLHIEIQQFAFIFNLIIALVAAVWVYIKQDSFLFNDNM